MSDVDLRARSVEWANEPDPPREDRNPHVIFEQPTEDAPCWAWDWANETDAWLQYDGELADIER